MKVLERFLVAAASPTPSIDPTFNPDTVTPGWVGFLITFLVAVVTVLLVMDMTRRVRRLRYREQARVRLLAERGSGLTEQPDREDRHQEDGAPMAEEGDQR